MRIEKDHAPEIGAADDAAAPTIKTKQPNANAFIVSPLCPPFTL
jgi:hypothetical protein